MQANNLKRCAVYTRKSSEEGLEQAFNSLDAQREASEAFIKSLAGVWLGALPIVLGLMTGLFAIMFIAFEIFAAAAYGASGNATFIALVESAWLAWILAAIMPITIAF